MLKYLDPVSLMLLYYFNLISTVHSLLTGQNHGFKFVGSRVSGIYITSWEHCPAFCAVRSERVTNDLTYSRSLWPLKSLLKMPVKLKSRRYKPEISVPLWYFLVHLIVELSKDYQLAFGLICFHNVVRHIISGYMSLIICSYYKKYFDWIQSQSTTWKKNTGDCQN